MAKNQNYLNYCTRYFSTNIAVENTNIWVHSIKELLISVRRFDLFNRRMIESPISVKRQISET